MIPIENFKAETTVENDDGKQEIVFCRVVGIVKSKDGETYDFLVMTEEADQRWIAQREFVTAPDGRTCWPD